MNRIFWIRATFTLEETSSDYSSQFFSDICFDWGQSSTQTYLQRFVGEDSLLSSQPFCHKYILGKFIFGQCPLYLILTSSLKMCIRCTVLCTIFKQGSLTRIHMPVFEAFLWSDIWTRHRCPGAREYGHHWPQLSQLVLKIETENLNSFWINTSYLTDSYISFTLKLESGQNFCSNRSFRSSAYCKKNIFEIPPCGSHFF